MNVLRGQVWRNVHGGHVLIDGVGLYDYHGGEMVEALLVDVCDADGNVTGGQIPMDAEGFPGPLWTLVGKAAS